MKINYMGIMFFSMLLSAGLIHLPELTKNLSNATSSSTAHRLSDEDATGLNALGHLAHLSSSQVLYWHRDGGLMRSDLETGSVQRIVGLPEEFMPSENEPSLASAGVVDVFVHPRFSTNNQVYISFMPNCESMLSRRAFSASIQGDALSDVKMVCVASPLSAVGAFPSS